MEWSGVTQKQQRMKQEEVNEKRLLSKLMTKWKDMVGVCVDYAVLWCRINNSMKSMPMQQHTSMAHTRRAYNSILGLGHEGNQNIPQTAKQTIKAWSSEADRGQSARRGSELRLCFFSPFQQQPSNSNERNRPHPSSSLQKTTIL